MTNRKRTMNDSWSSFVPTRSIKKDIEFKGLYNKRHTGKVQISSVSGIFGFNLHCDVYFFLSVSKKNGKIWHMLFCGTFVAYMYTLIMIVYYSREPGSRTGVADMVLWSNWGMTLQMHAYFIENIVLFIPFGLIFPLVFKNWMRWFTIPVGAFISAAIEYTQLVTGRGYCQLDDFVTNTAGAAIGFFIYLILYAGWLVWKKIR